jgi:hypothetical protein
MRIKQIVLGLILMAAPLTANAAWRVYHGGRDAPPPPVEEHPRTRAGYVWVGGHHNYRHDHYVWAPGRLVRVHRGHDWENGRWERHDDHYDWHDGGWRAHR